MFFPPPYGDILPSPYTPASSDQLFLYRPTPGGLLNIGPISLSALPISSTLGSVPFVFGSNVSATPTVNPQVLLQSLISSGSAHGFSDNSTTTGGWIGLGFASYDSNTIMAPSTAQDHFVGFQVRDTFSAAQTLTNWYSFSSGGTLNNAGAVITNAYAFYNFGITKTAGAITNYAAFYDAVATTLGTGNNYGIYITYNPSYFGGAVTSAGRVTTTNPSGSNSGIGYGTGAGQSVTQSTSKSTSVTLNGVTGQITMNNASLNSATAVTFTWNNSSLGGDDVIVMVPSGTTGSAAGSYSVQVTNNANFTSTVTLTNTSGGALAEAVILKFAVIKASHN